MKGKWKFPIVEGVIVDEETGRWSTEAFANDLLSEKGPETWHQAQPADHVDDAAAWEKWLAYLDTPAARETVISVLKAEGRARMEGSISDDGAGESVLARNREPIFFVPLKQPRDVRPHLAKWSHWKPQRSAYELAWSWYDAGGIPASVRAVLDSCDAYRGAEVIQGIFERQVVLDSSPRHSQSDLSLLLRLKAGRALIAVEGKVDEGFDKPVHEWLGESRGKKLRLAGLCERLRLAVDAVDDIRYQLLHRTAAALIEAEQLGARHAMMLVHAFTIDNPSCRPDDDSFAHFQRFAQAMGMPIERAGTASQARGFDGIELRLAWVPDRIRGTSATAAGRSGSAPGR